jgi:hypothetical protein
MSPLVLQCQKALNAISSRHVVGLYWVPGHARIRGNETADWRLGSEVLWARAGPGGLLCKSYKKRISRWLYNPHWARWRGLGDTQRQTRELISGPSLGARARFLSFNRTQVRVVTGLLTGHNTLRRHLHLLGLADSPMCRRCCMEEETSAHILCECEALASSRFAHLGSFF